MVEAAQALQAKDPANENQRHEDKTCNRNSQQPTQHTDTQTQKCKTKDVAVFSWGSPWFQSTVFRFYLIWNACASNI